jgi:hypothetical protein
VRGLVSATVGEAAKAPDAGPAGAGEANTGTAVTRIAVDASATRPVVAAAMRVPMFSPMNVRRIDFARW